LTPEQQKSVRGCLEALEAYFKLQRNVVYEIYVFSSCVQSQDKNVDAYVNRLRKLASSCDFGALTDELIGDRCKRQGFERSATQAKRIIVAESVGNEEVKRGHKAAVKIFGKRRKEEQHGRDTQV